MAPIAICTPPARIARASRLALVSALAVAVYSALAGAKACFASAPALLERPRLGGGGQRAAGGLEDAIAKALVEASESALELATGEPIGTRPGTTQNPPWATCFVQGRQEEKSVLEEWVMRGDRENVDSFRRWRQRGAEPTSVRCMETSAKAAMEAICLECVPHDGLPFTPAGHLQGGMLTFTSTQCVRSMTGGSGFCKSGIVSIP